jgi:RNA polymerase sigma factor (sigma-70 family)
MIDVERVYRDHADAVHGAVRRRFSRTAVSDALIEDGCAQAWTIAWRSRERIEPDNPVGWVVVVAVHEVFALLRKSRFESLHELEPDLATSQAGDPGLALEVREALKMLGALKPSQTLVLTLKTAGFSYKEIEEITGRTYTWVNRHVSEGRKALRATNGL